MCIKACKNVAGQGVLKLTKVGNKKLISTVNGKPLQETSCIKCGQCTLVCPTGALAEKDGIERLEEVLKNPGDKVIVCQTAPAIRINLADAVGMPSGTIITGKMVTALKQLGFKYVFDTNFGADLTIMEEATELVNRLQDPNATLPMFTSCCPAWVNYVEQSAPDFIPNLSSCRSPQGMLSSCIKNYLPKVMGIDAKDIINISVMPCTAKKDEIERPALRTKDGLKETDYVLTVRELVELIKLNNIDFNNLPDSEFDQMFGFGSGAGQIFAATGGVMEAAARTAFEMVTGKNLTNVDLVDVRGMDGLKIATFDLEGTKLKVAVCHGIANTAKLLDMIRSKDPRIADVKFIEVMACPGGCVVGGGTPQPKCKNTFDNRLSGVYRIDSGMNIRLSHENPIIKTLYKDLLGKPNSHIAHELLHTHYREHPKP